MVYFTQQPDKLIFQNTLCYEFMEQKQVRLCYLHFAELYGMQFHTFPGLNWSHWSESLIKIAFNELEWNGICNENDFTSDFPVNFYTCQ